MKVKFGIAGPGVIARKMAQAICLCEEAELFAVASRDIERARAFCEEYGGQCAYGSYEEMFCDPQIDAVYIALPNGLHASVAIQAMKHGKAVLCEKPFAPSRAEAEEAVRYAKEHNILVVVAMWTRWLPVVQKAKEWVHAGKIGNPAFMNASNSFYSQVNPQAHRYQPQMGGGALMDVGCYCVDNMMYIADEKPDIISGALKIGETGVDELGCLALRFPSGFLAHGAFGIRAEVSTDGWIYGTEGKILMKNFWACREAICYDAQGNEIDHYVDDQENGFVYELREFCSLFRNGGKQSCYMSLDDTLACAEVMDTIRSRGC